MNARMEGNASTYNELYGSPTKAETWGDASSRRAKFDDYMRCRTGFEARLRSENSFVKTLMKSPGPISSEESMSLRYALDQIINSRMELQLRSSEFSKSYGDSVEDLASEQVGKKLKATYGIRSKDEILIDCIRIYDDPYASFRAGGVVIDSDKNDHALDIKAVYGASARSEWERCYPQDDFYDAYDTMLKKYDARQKKAIKDYIDNMDYLGNLDRMSDYYSSEGMIDDWKETRMKIGAATREKNRMREAWRKFYGKDSLREAAAERYDEIYPGRKYTMDNEVGNESVEFENDLVM